MKSSEITFFKFLINELVHLLPSPLMNSIFQGFASFLNYLKPQFYELLFFLPKLIAANSLGSFSEVFHQSFLFKILSKTFKEFATGLTGQDRFNGDIKLLFPNLCDFVDGSKDSNYCVWCESLSFKFRSSSQSYKMMRKDI